MQSVVTYAPVSQLNNAKKENAMDGRVRPQCVTIDQHYTPQWYAELWGISVSTVIRWFQDEPGVLRLNEPSNNGKRTRVELRIPISIADRVYRERTKQK